MKKASDMDCYKPTGSTWLDEDGARHPIHLTDDVEQGVQLLYEYYRYGDDKEHKLASEYTDTLRRLLGCTLLFQGMSVKEIVHNWFGLVVNGPFSTRQGQKPLAPGTKRSYHTVLKKKLTVVKQHKLAEQDDIEEAFAATLQWGRATKKLIPGRKRDVSRKHTASILSCVDLQRYLSGSLEEPRRAITKLGELMQDPESVSALSDTDINNIRTFLQCHLMMSNAQRAGVVLNFTVAEFQSAKEVVHDGKSYRVVRVETHKTAATYGAATLVLTRELAEWLEVYVTSIRPVCLSRDTEHKETQEVFIRPDGKAMDNSYQAKCVRRHFDRMGFKGVTPTIIRMSVITNTAQLLNTAEMRTISVLSTHSQRVQADYYVQVRDEIQAAVAAQALVRSTINKLAHDATSPLKKQRGEEEEKLMPAKRKRVHEDEEEGEEEEEEEDEEKEKEQQGEKDLETFYPKPTPSEGRSEASSKRYGVFNQQENAQIKRLLKPLISKRVKLGSMATHVEIVECLSGSKKGKDFLASKSRNQLYQKFKSVYNNERRRAK